MDAISSALQGTGMQDITKLLGVASTGENLYNQYENQQYQDKLRSYAQDPAKMNAYAKQFTQPLDAGLQQGVANQSQAYLAERGLSASPYISEQVESQAIAPYIQQNQNQGYQNAITALGLGGGAVNPGQQQQQLMAQLAKMFSGTTGLSPLQKVNDAYNSQQAAQLPSVSSMWNPSTPEVPNQPIDLQSFFAQPNVSYDNYSVDNQPSDYSYSPGQ